MTAAAPSVGSLRQYGRIVKDRSLLRRVLTATYEIQASVHGHEGEPRDLVERAERTILEVAHDDRQKEFRKVGDVLHTEIGKWQKLSAEGQSLTGTPSGFADLDAITGGFQPGNLIVIAARPSMGKSALVTNMAENVALHKDRPRPVALFSLEMSEAELAQRFIASQASIKGDDLRKGRLKDETKWKRVLRVAAEYDAAPLYVDDSSDIGILDVRAKARRLHQQSPDGLGLVIVDYLQLMRADARIENRVQQVGEMSRGLKILARELEVPVIALSQLSRGVESRTDKRPMLSDLRECVTGDTLVVLADGRRVPIRELVGTTARRAGMSATTTASSARAATRSGRSGGARSSRCGSPPVARCARRPSIASYAGAAGRRSASSSPAIAWPSRGSSPSRRDRSAGRTTASSLLGHLIGDGSYLDRPADAVHDRVARPTARRSPARRSASSALASGATRVAATGISCSSPATATAGIPRASMRGSASSASSASARTRSACPRRPSGCGTRRSRCSCATCGRRTGACGRGCGAATIARSSGSSSRPPAAGSPRTWRRCCCGSASSLACARRRTPGRRPVHHVDVSGVDA